MLDLHVNTTKTIDHITTYLEQHVAHNGTEGVILGLSGGLDSAVLAALAVKALGASAVTALYMYDKDSDPDIGCNARMMAEYLGIYMEEMDITDEMTKRGAYASPLTKMMHLSGVFSYLGASGYELACGETPFKSCLRDGAGEELHPWYKAMMFDMTMRHVNETFIMRHTYRREIIECLAEERNLSPIGSTNRSESEIGWFVKDGVDDLPVQPLAGLLKTQIHQLADALELPDTIRTQYASPDMAKGVTDEFGIGHDYSFVDMVIDGLDRGLTETDIVGLGIEREEVDDICDLIHLSAWKRTSPHEAPPVSGKYGSALRGMQEEFHANAKTAA